MHVIWPRLAQLSISETVPFLPFENRVSAGSAVRRVRLITAPVQRCVGEKGPLRHAASSEISNVECDGRFKLLHLLFLPQLLSVCRR